MTKAELRLDMQSKAGWVATNKDTIKSAVEDGQGIVIQIKGFWSVEYTDENGLTNFTDVNYSEDLPTNTAKYIGSPPIFQRSPTQESINSNLLYNYFNSINAWKAYTVEYINPARLFAVLTTVQKDASNKFYEQRVLVFDQTGLTNKNIEKSSYVPVP